MQKMHKGRQHAASGIKPVMSSTYIEMNDWLIFIESDAKGITY